MNTRSSIISIAAATAAAAVTAAVMLSAVPSVGADEVASSTHIAPVKSAPVKTVLDKPAELLPQSFIIDADTNAAMPVGPAKPADADDDNGLALVSFDSERVDQAPPTRTFAPAPPGQAQMPIDPQQVLMGFQPWWQSMVVRPQQEAGQALEMSVDELILAALRHSHLVRAQSELPLIAETAIIEAAAEFDVQAFTRSHFTRTSEPIGSLLVTGPGRTRFRDELWNHSAGVRRRTRKGGSLEVLQRYGWQQNNSDFLNPNPQSTAQLALRFSQPLLRGRGTAYNTSVIVLAQIDKNISWQQFRGELQDYLVEVSVAYWDIYLQRAVMLQRQRHLERAMEIEAELEKRRGIDAANSQIVRAVSAVASRRSDLARAKAAVRNAQVRLRAIANLPALHDPAVELIPRETPRHDYVQLGTEDALVTALDNRPEIGEVMQQLRSARMQVAVSEHELLPILDLVTESYVSGLRPNAGIGQAWIDQFSVGEPSYSVGIEMQVPLHNRAAKARNRRKRLQLRSLVSRYQGTMETICAEAEVAVIDVQTAYAEMAGKFHAIKASKAELEYLTAHWRLLPGDDRSASFLLEDILDVQDRLVVHEFEFVSAQVAYAQSLVTLKRATGTLLQAEEVSTCRSCECGLPRITAEKVPQDDGFAPIDEAVGHEFIPPEGETAN